MSPGKFSMFRGFVLFCALFSAGAFSVQVPYAQNAPPASVSVSVKMIDLADSGSDPAGKQYRASVTKLVSAGNGAAVPAGSAAIVTLAQTPNGWAAQLSSLTIAGQSVPVTSVSANVISSAQSTAASAANTVGSVLGGFGHHASPPAAVTAVASGQRVILPPGVTITFVLAAPPSPAAAAPDAASAPSPAPEAPAAPATRSPIPAPAAATALPSRAPIPAPASPSAAPVRSAIPVPTSTASSASATGNSSGGVTAMEICFSNPPPNPSDLNHKTEFLTAVFEVPVDSLKAVPVIEPAFSAYLKSTYQYPSAGITCQPIWSITDAQAAQKKIAADRDTAKLNMVDTGWRYGQPPLSAGQNGFDPLAQGPGGLDLSQHRLTTYFCTLIAPGGTSMTPPPGPANQTAYISPIFQADWDSAAVSKAYDVYIRDNYVHDLSLSDLSPRCTTQSPTFQAMMHPNAGVGKLITHKVAVDWTYTPAQAAAAQVAAAPAAAAASPTASTASSAGGPFIACSTSGGAGIDTYLTGVFQTTHPVRHMPNGANVVDQSVLDRFYAYLTQKGYNFKPGSGSGCAVGRTEAEAEAAKHKRYYEGGGCSTCGKTVETGWKDTQ